MKTLASKWQLGTPLRNVVSVKNPLAPQTLYLFEDRSVGATFHGRRLIVTYEDLSRLLLAVAVERPAELAAMCEVFKAKVTREGNVGRIEFAEYHDSLKGEGWSHDG